ncbi:hypothetical protein IAU60_005538 [Kwoniella sp. DSM 27419]
MPGMRSKRAWLLLAASMTLHIFLLVNTRAIGDRKASPPGKRLVRRLLVDESLSTSNILLELPYQDWYESLPPSIKPFYIIALLLILAFLFSFIGISASDFFCPNLSTIASYLGLNESTAGVTFLAFGNGSPDVFSTFSAMKGGTFGLAIGELIGAASFITSIVVGSIAFIRPFHVPRHAFLRDVLFFTTAVVVLMIVLRDGHLTLAEAAGMVILYVGYVVVVVGGNWLGRRKQRQGSHEQHVHGSKSPIGTGRTGITSVHSSPFLSPIVQPTPDTDEALVDMASPGEMTPLTPRPAYGRSRSHTTASHRGALPPHHHLHHHDSMDTPRANFSLLGAIEFRDVVNSLRKESSSRAGSPSRTPNGGERDQGDYFGPISASAHRRSSSYGFSAALPGGVGAKRHSSLKGRRRASTHSSPSDGGSNAITPTAQRPPGRIPTDTSVEPNPWEDQTGNPPTPLPSAHSGLSVPGMKPDRPKVHIPDPPIKDPPGQLNIPSIALVDPSGHTGVPPDQPTPPMTRRHGESRFRIRRRSKIVLRVLFPSLQSFRHKSIIGMILAVTSVPAILVLTLTLPVVDDGGLGDEGAIALPVADDEGLNGQDAWGGEEHDVASSQASSYESEADHLLAPQVGEELHHLVDHGFSPLHSPLGRISHTHMRRMTEHAEAGEGLVEDGQDGGQAAKENWCEEGHEEDDLGFNKYLTAAQCVLGPTFCSYIILGDQSYYLWVLLGLSIGGSVAAVAVLYYATDGSAYTWRLVRTFCGFTCSMVWIAAIADEVVGVLNTVGEILGLSDAIIGLTIFAVGNSLADLVANVTVAQFAPAMAYAACFGGPMLNLLLGVGGSGTYHILSTPSHTPVIVHFSPTLWVSASGLVAILIATAIFVPINGYLIDRRWASCLIAAYLVLMVVNIAVEVKTGRE